LEVGRGRDRDQELSALFVEFYDPLRRLAFVMMGDKAVAEEIVMEAFEKALSRWRLFSGADHPPAYMRQIVVNLCRSKIRRKILERKTGELFERSAEEAVESDIESYGVNIEVWNAVRKLPHRQKACVVLRYLEDLSEPEVARVLDIPVGTVKSQLSRARKKLGEWLGSDIMIEAEA
jgi:RNA polymerase sigma-70 factor (sigma-E family)